MEVRFRDCEAWKCENSYHVVTNPEELQQVFEYSNEEWVEIFGKWMDFGVIGVGWFSWQSSCDLNIILIGWNWRLDILVESC